MKSFQSLRDQIQENNQELEKLKRNLSRLQETSDWNQQMRSQEQLDLVSEIKRKYEREKAVLMEENKKARTDLEKVRVYPERWFLNYNISQKH